MGTPDEPARAQRRAAARPIRVVVADDQPVVRDGLRTILGSMGSVTVVGLAANGAEAVAEVARTGADVVLMDLQMPGVSGVEAIRRLAATSPDAAVVVLTTYVDDDSILDALRAGATGYLTKHATADDIRRALEGAVAGQSILDTGVRARLVDHAADAVTDIAPGELPDGLSAREGEVLALVAEGLSNTEIAERLYVSRATVKSHINQILRKTGSRDRPQAMVYARRHRIGALR